MSNWRISRLGDVCEMIKRGIGPKYLEEHGICVINQKCVRDHSVNYDLARRHDVDSKKVNEERYVKAGDVLVNSTGTGTLGRVAQVKLSPPEPTTVDTHVTIVRPKPNLFHDEFFGYMLIKIEEEITSAGEGASGQTELARTKLENEFFVSYPDSIPEQQRIVSILDQTFADIEKARANAEKNLKNARELFDNYLFGIFGRPHESWVETTVGDLCVKMEYGSSAKSQNEGEIPVLRMGNLQKGEIDWTDLKYSADPEEIKKYMLQKGDVLFNRTNSDEHVGKTAIYRGEMPAIFAGYLIRVHRKQELLDGDFLNFYLNSSIARDYGKTVMSRSVNQANINASKLKEYPIIVPDMKTQKQLVSIFSSLKDEVERLEKVYVRKLSLLDTLKKSILQKAFSGELTKTEGQAA